MGEMNAVVTKLIPSVATIKIKYDKPPYDFNGKIVIYLFLYYRNDKSKWPISHRWLFFALAHQEDIVDFFFSKIDDSILSSNNPVILKKGYSIIDGKLELGLNVFISEINERYNYDIDKTSKSDLSILENLISVKVATESPNIATYIKQFIYGA